jgi:hypothetical protein
MPLNIVSFPERHIGDIPRALRDLADSIEAGHYDDAHVIAWVIDCGEGKVEVGLLGQTAEPGAVAHYLFALAQRKLESVAS